MKKVLLLLLLTMFCIGQNIVAQNSNKSFVHCLILDKTQSMTGYNGADNIWQDVQIYCGKWVDGVVVPSTVVFFTFAEDLSKPQIFELNSESDKSKLKKAIENVKVDGWNTYIYSNLEKAMNYLYENYPDDIKKQIYLLTDGADNQPGKDISDFKSVLNSYSDKRSEFDYLYYVDLLDKANPDLKLELDKTPGGGYGKGYVKFITLNRLFPNITYTIGESTTVKQLFEVMADSLLSELSFNLTIDSVTVDRKKSDVSIDITPSRGISGSIMEKKESGKYEIPFKLDFYDSITECDIYVSMKGNSKDDVNVEITPNDFCIKVRNKAKIKLAKPIIKGFE